MDRSRHSGFTLVELVITIIVLSVLAVVAIPNYVELRERQALRGVAENFQVAIGLAKQESIKRGEPVRIEFNAMGDSVCMGAVVVDDVDDDGCDCSADTCDVAAFPDEPGNTGALRGVTLEGDVLFGADDNGFVIDPRTGTLADVGSTGGFALATANNYQVQLDVNIMARATLCTPDGAEKLAGVDACE